MVNSTLQNTKGISVECMECLNKDAKKKKKDRFCISQVAIIKNATSTKLLEIIHESYGFNSDLIEAIN